MSDRGDGGRNMKNKQMVIISYILLLFIGANSSLFIQEPQAQTSDQLVIPDEAIRLRILANSDSEKDQNIKRIIRDEVNQEITKWVEELTSIQEARDIIKARLDEIEVIVAGVLERENSDQAYKVEFGNVEFPTKLYGKFIYPAGQYEAILITLGEGGGANWWCVLFPPLCFLDFSNGDAVKAEEAEAKEGTEEENEKKENTEEENEKKENTEEETSEDEEVEDVALEEVEDEEAEEKSEVESEEAEGAEVKFFIVEFFSSIFG